MLMPVMRPHFYKSKIYISISSLLIFVSFRYFKKKVNIHNYDISLVIRAIIADDSDYAIKQF